MPDATTTRREAPVAAPPEYSGGPCDGDHARAGDYGTRPRALPGIGNSGFGAVALLAALALPLSGCGESQQDKAEKAAIKTVCSAKSDIKTRLATLKTITPSPAAIPQLKEEGQAIFEDLKKIKEAQPDLAPARKQQVHEATEAFQHEISSILSSVSSLTTSSLSSAGAQLEGALSRLEQSYVKALEPIECGS